MASEQSEFGGFARSDPRAFDSALSEYIRNARTLSKDAHERTLFNALTAISDSDVLGPREQDRRASILLKSVALDDRLQKQAALLGQQLAAPVRNAIARSVAPQHRQLTFASATATHVGAVPLTSDNKDAAAFKVSAPRDAVTCGVVLLVGTRQEHEHNGRILEREQINWIRAKSPAEAESLLTDDVTAISVARSCWTAFPSNDHAGFLDRICRFSSFTFLKVDTTGYADPNHFDRTCSVARCRGPGLSEVSHGDSPNFAETDLPKLRIACEALSGDERVHLYPIDIPANTARMLIAGVRKLVDHRHFPNDVHLCTIGTKTMQGGKSQALLVQAHPDDQGPPLVIKVASLSLLRDEFERFATFIQPWDNLLRPHLHFHGAEGLIIFSLVDTPDEPQSPAPTLEHHFECAWRAENGNPLPSLTRSEFFALIDRTVQKLSELNSRPCTTQLPSLAWMTLEPLDEAMSRGLRWEFPSTPTGEHPIDLARKAAAALMSCGSVATVHGDMHLRNILVRDRREPYVIDYAYSGPGHPCFDLTWLATASLFRFFRMMGGEDRLIGLLSKASDPSVSFDALSTEFSIECASVTNQAALYAVIACRDACLKLLARYSAPRSHYQMMMLLVACQSLIRLDVQAAVVRAMVSAAAASAPF